MTRDPKAPGGRAADRAIWDHYWQSDRIASCFDDAGARNYDDAVAGGWRDFFAGLLGGARVLDLCTGNGAVAILAAEASEAGAKGFTVTAVDQAEIDPPRFVSRHRGALTAIRFVPRTEVENLPFPDGAFDAVTSQYGIEYADLPRALAEVGRVVAPGGRVRLVLHAAEGVVSADARHVIADADFLLETIDLPGAAQRCFAAVTAAERTRDASEGLHGAARESLAAFEAALEQTARRVPMAADPKMLRNSAGVLFDTFRRHARLDEDQLIAKTDEVRTNISDHRGRLQALVDAAVSEADLPAIAAALSAAGAREVKLSGLRKDSGLIGHVVEADFPA